VPSRAGGSGALAVASALAEETSCALRGLSAVAGSGLGSSLLSGASVDDMESFGTSKMVVPFVVISAWTLSIAGGQRSPEVVRLPSWTPISSFLAPGRLNAAAMQRD
jgi:hypothetical protein